MPDLGELALDNIYPVLLLIHYANGFLEEEDLGVVDISAHPLVHQVLTNHQAVILGGLRRVLPFDQLNLDIQVEDHRVGHVPGGGPHVLHRLQSILEEFCAPLLLVDLFFFDDVLDDLLDVIDLVVLKVVVPGLLPLACGIDIGKGPLSLRN